MGLSAIHCRLAKLSTTARADKRGVVLPPKMFFSEIPSRFQMLRHPRQAGLDTLLTAVHRARKASDAHTVHAHHDTHGRHHCLWRLLTIPGVLG